MTTAELNQYITALQGRWPVGFYVPRAFRTADDWKKWSAFAFRSSLLTDREPCLEDILGHRRLVLLGEPGSGKSTIGRQAIIAARDRGWIPVFVPLKSYIGDLPALIAQNASREIVAARDVDGNVAARLYIFDGLDEAPAEHLDALVRDVDRLSDTDAPARFFVTSRQAFFVNRDIRFGQPFVPFYLLGLSGDGIDVVIGHFGVSRERFLESTGRVGVSRELTNPLALGALLTLYRDTGSVGAKKSDALRHMVDSLLESRPTSDPRRQKRALRMLAVAMETHAHNELTVDQARTVSERSLRVRDASANRLLEELAQTILVRTPQGYAFQMQSYGEYLAAEELSDIRERDSIISLMFVDGTRIPADSWRNAVSYLVELHSGVRSYFSRRHPDWVLTSAPSEFTEGERATVVRELLATLVRRREYLVHHPTIRAFDLGRFVVPPILTELREALNSVDEIVVANAVLLLGAADDRDTRHEALRLALDQTMSWHVRHSALASLERIGEAAFVPRLLDIEDWNEQTTVARIHTAAAVTSADHFGAVIAASMKTDTTISSMFGRLDELRDAREIEAVLDGLLGLRPEAMSSRLNMYVGPFWKALVEHWQPRWTEKVAALIFRFEESAAIDDSDVERLTALLRRLPDQGSAIGRLLLERLLSAERDVHHLYHSIPQLVSPSDAVWLTEQPRSEGLVRSVRAFGPPETSAVLRRPATPEEEAMVARWRQEEERRQTRIERQIRTIAESDNTDELLRALIQLEERRWPELGPQRIRWLTDFTSRTLVELNLPRTIVWTSDTQYRQPGVLPMLLKVVDRYEIRLGDDRPLAYALLSESHVTRRYHERYGLSAEALTEVENLVSDATTPNGGLEGSLVFVRDAKVSTARVVEALERLGMDAVRPARVRRLAVDALTSIRATDALLRVGPRLTADLRSEVEDRLVDAQDRGTIERRLQALLDNPVELAAGEVELYASNPLRWIGAIRLPAVWEKLKTLRRHALQQGLGNVTTTLTETMAKIDAIRVAGVIREQVDLAPAEWRPFQRVRAVEHEREGRIRAAQAAPFDRVLARMQDATTLNRFKIWVEGPTDVPAIDVLAAKLPDPVARNVVAQQFGGWNQIMNRHWTPAGLGHGCRDYIVLLDGDGAYDYRKPGLTFKPDVRAALRKLEERGIEYRILERYGLEHYFPQHAFEAVFGRALGQYFPLEQRRSLAQQLPGYHKDMNSDLATKTALADLAGTDLADFLNRAERLAAD